MNARATWLFAAVLAGAPWAFGEDSVTPERRALFGDLHIHTMFSFDAFLGSVRTTPDHAYRYARGEAIPHPSGETLRLSGAPLDFLAVTDHGEYLGVHAALIDPASATYGHPDTDLFVPSLSRQESNERIPNLLQAMNGSTAAADPVIATAWKKSVAAAERHNDPGAFTALIGYEYTPTPGGRHLHRNVIFRGSDVPELPFTWRDSGDPSDLWAWLDAKRAAGIEAMGIPHNTNQSDGLAFMETTWEGEPIDAEFAAARARNEPVVEITQKKGTSETHPSLSPNDEWADFQIVQYYLDRANNKDPISVFKGGYLRDALKTGLEFEARIGVNPYRLGVVAASDSHVSGGSYEEDRYFSNRTNTPQARGSAYTAEQGSWEGYWTPRVATHGTGGLAGVWAESNTRASIYDAMRRRESFGTSGPRIRVRMFAGFGLADALADADDRVAAAYRHGVPMGGMLPAEAEDAPDLLVQAMRDPLSGWLQRLQVVKGWLEDGEARERVFDVACSDGLAPDPDTHRCPNNGARVNLTDCSVTRDRGATALEAVWTDPSFDSGQRAFYYARVLENPSCRWSTWDALRLGIEPNPDLPATIQERAWGSSVWYSPAG
ncbi:MAG: DUF3604 domain-containing protein [Gammaproteobacteria bacterium]|nr:DUF3604 domain-containing protein [Gammaproteobacteria bacterium]